MPYQSRLPHATVCGKLNTKTILIEIVNNPRLHISNKNIDLTSAFFAGMTKLINDLLVVPGLRFFFRKYLRCMPSTLRDSVQKNARDSTFPSETQTPTPS